MFLRHPSDELNELFAEKPYQGAAPDQAKFLFVGLDANYAAQIADKPIFSEIRDYHRDGVEFWQQRRIHHPFLLSEYSGGGKKYHRSFAQIGFRPEHASLVSFIELLHVPTVGQNKRLSPGDFNAPHLMALNGFILEGRAEHIFISDTVARLMCATAAFPWLPKTHPTQGGPLAIRYQRGPKTVYAHLHFSAWGVCSPKKREETAQIRRLIPTVPTSPPRWPRPS